eukprot:6452239-Heterocapsa_arctica.AAC.1
MGWDGIGWDWTGLLGEGPLWDLQLAVLVVADLKLLQTCASLDIEEVVDTAIPFPGCLGPGNLGLSGLLVIPQIAGGVGIPLS